MKITIKSVLICLLTFVNMAVIAQDEIPNLKKQRKEHLRLKK